MGQLFECRRTQCPKTQSQLWDTRMKRDQLWDTVPGTTMGSTKGAKENVPNRTKEGISKFLENNKKLCESIKNQSAHKSTTTSAASIATASTASDSNLDSENDSLINLNPFEVMPKTSVGLSSTANVQMDPNGPTLTPPLDVEFNKMLVIHDKSNQKKFPPPLITLDSPDIIVEPRAAVIDTGAKTAVANPLHLLH